MKTTYIFGHKQPDSDSVCSSIALSYLKNQLGDKTEPRVLGAISNETKFALDYFKIPEPLYLNDVKVQIRNMHYTKNAFIDEKVSLEDAFYKLNELKVTGLPLVNNEKKLIGYVNLKEIATFLITGKVTRLISSYDNILKTLEGTEILRFNDEISGAIMATTFKISTFMETVDLSEKHIVITGDRDEIVEKAIEKKVQLIILVAGHSVSESVIEKARQNKINVISTPFYSYKVSNRIRMANYVSSVEINNDPIKFYETDYRNDFLDISHKYGHTNYPVIKKNNECVGMIRLVDSGNFDKRPVILVDHNQQSQSVEGLEESEIIEIVDHHNLGTIGTTYPINFRSMPVGCTATLIYKLFKESYVMIPKHIAGIMLSAILSDTLIFKSPTTTELDKSTAEKLAIIAGVNIEEYGIAMFKAGSSIQGLSHTEIINQDFKTFKVDDKYIGIGQVMTLDFEAINKDKETYIKLLNEMSSDKNYNVVLLFVTDIISNGSYMFYNDSAKNIVSDAYNIDELSQGIYLEGIVSRKKQMLPALMECIISRGN